MSYIYDVNGKKIDIEGMLNTQEPLDDDIPIVSLSGELPTTKSQGALSVLLEYKSTTKSFSSYATAKVQGDSSQNYPKKNFTIALYSDQERTKKDKRKFKNWDKGRNKYVLKANWIDHSHARNIVTARLWTQIVKSRTDYESLPDELKSGNIAIDGFPVKIFNNGVYMGLYTWNLPKGAMYGVDDEIPENCIMQGDGSAFDNTLFFRSSTMDGKWSDEIHDEMPQVIENSWTSVLNFVYTSSNSSFKNNLTNYFDKQSLIDMHIFLRCGCIVDQLAKNQTFFTYDAQKWFSGMYDMDGTWGLAPWMPAERGWLSHETHFQTGYTAYTDGNHVTNLLHDKLWGQFKTDIKTRYSELRSSILSSDNIITEFEKFMSIIPPYLYAEDYATTTGGGEYTGIPLVETNNILQIRNFVPKRLAYCDSQVLT